MYVKMLISLSIYRSHGRYLLLTSIYRYVVKTKNKPTYVKILITIQLVSYGIAPYKKILFRWKRIPYQIARTTYVHVVTVTLGSEIIKSTLNIPFFVCDFSKPLWVFNLFFELVCRIFASIIYLFIYLIKTFCWV